MAQKYPSQQSISKVYLDKKRWKKMSCEMLAYPMLLCIHSLWTVAFDIPQHDTSSSSQNDSILMKLWGLLHFRNKWPYQSLTSHIMSSHTDKCPCTPLPFYPIFEPIVFLSLSFHLVTLCCPPHFFFFSEHHWIISLSLVLLCGLGCLISPHLCPLSLFSSYTFSLSVCCWHLSGTVV